MAEDDQKFPLEVARKLPWPKRILPNVPDFALIWLLAGSSQAYVASLLLSSLYTILSRISVLFFQNPISLTTSELRIHEPVTAGKSISADSAFSVAGGIDDSGYGIDYHSAASAFVVAGAYFSVSRASAQRGEEICATGGGINQREALTPAKVEAGSRSELMQFEDIKDLIVDEDGLDVLYWKKLKNYNGSIHNEPMVRVNCGIGGWDTPTVPSGRSSSSHGQILPGQRREGRRSGVALQAPMIYGGGVSGRGQPLPFYPAPSSTAILTPLEYSSTAPSAALQARVNYGGGVGGGGQPLPFYPVSSSMVLSTPPASSSTAILTAPALGPPVTTPPPPSLPEKKISPVAPPPPPPPAPAKKAPPPPPPPKPGKKIPPAAPKPPSAGSKTSEAAPKEGGSGSGKDQVMLKPLHWEKLNVNPDHSMIWDKIERGSFQYSDDKMEALFGFVPTNRKSAMEENPNNKPSDPNAKVFILDPRKSRNTAIVLKSLGIPRSELIDSLLEGRGLSIETLEKLARTVPTLEEESEILAFDGDPSKLADAESFLYSLLKAVPLAFTRANAMLFRLNYDSEVLNVKEPLQAMEPACNELRSHGMLLRLLEAILKAGNRLNAGTARGDAKAFNLTTLLKLSDFKSSDGKTTLLSFVVHEVIRNEGRKSVLTRKNEMDIKNDVNPNNPAEKEEEKDKELLRLGLPVLSGLGSEFLNVKKAASIDYDAVKNTLSSLTNRLDETKELVSKCKSSGGGGGFLQEMEQFLKSAQVEMKAIQEEHTRVMNLVKKTTQYYQAGASNDKNPLQLFTIVKDFLGMVDQTCAAIGRSLQPKKPTAAAASATSGPSSTQQDAMRTRVIFPGFKEHFLLANKSSYNSSDSEDDF